MNYSDIIFTIVFIIVCIVGFIHGYRGKTKREPKDFVPIMVPMSEIDDYEPQEVYDWITYVTLTTGTTYLDQQAWDWRSRHIRLLFDLRTVLKYPSRDAQINRMRYIASSHGLDTRVLNMHS